MPVYSGGKSKIGKIISNFIIQFLNNSNIDFSNRTYLEPFCGCLGVMRHISGFNNLIANDFNPNIILMWRKIQQGWTLPNEIGKDEFKSIQETKSAENGFYSITSSYSGIIGGGFRTNHTLKNGKKINFFQRSKNDIQKIGVFIKESNIEFLNQDYSDFNPENMVIYCDPPYKDNKFRVPYFNDFDSVQFWELMRKWSSNNIVFISEYEAPSDFTCVWEMPMKTTFGKKSKNRNEKIFMLI